MFRLTLRNLLARKVRLVMSGLAIILGVAFLSGVLIFSHGLSTTFDSIIKGSTPDGQVRATGTEAFTAGSNGVSAVTLTPADVAKLAALPQVARADGSVDGYGMNLLDHRGALVGGTGAPTLAFNETGTPDIAGNPILLLTQGRWPSSAAGASEIVLDTGAAKRAGYRVGDTVALLAPYGKTERHARLVGTAEFNGGGTGGSTLLIFSTTGAQQLFLGGADAFTSVSLTAAPGVSQRQLVDAAARVVPHGFEAVTGDEIVKESQSAIGTFLDVISTFLLVFALIAVIVGGFIIINTFTILVAQRTRELALLRALGASQRQVTRSVLAEAFVMALVASTIGIGVGWLLARGLAALFRAVGLDIASHALALTPSAIGISYAVGTLVTLVAAWLPSRRAGRVPPVAAMRGDTLAPPTSLRRRSLIGAGVIVLGAVIAVAGLLGAPGPAAAYVGVAAFLWIMTLATLSSVVGRPVLVMCRELFARLFGISGRLAGENALRDPRRTGATASALMIGLALVSIIGVLASSLNKTVDDLVNKEFTADFLVQSTNYLPFSAELGDQLAAVPGVGLVNRRQLVQTQLVGDASDKTLYVAADDPTLTSIYHLEMTSGVAKVDDSTALVESTTASQHHWRVGSAVTLGFPGGAQIKVTIGGIYKPTQTMASMSIPRSLLAQAGINGQDTSLSLMLAPGAQASTVKAALEKITEKAKIIAVYDKVGYADQLRGQVNQLLYMIYGLLALAIVIAVIGIINTLGLSVIERTREIGLLRAIGMSRARVRRMVTLESVAIAVLGAVLGMVVGVLTGVLLRQALRHDLTSLGLPWGNLVAFGIISIVVGVLAAVLPAARASRLNVLGAIASE
ncbi:FtsX-like permease family protein [Nocardioides sp.]|uniref:ABC transporter permease n=1 Tax=Nocardioides sp. TaxID=35761 RepID=UPI00263368E1|nr:FtsX-like permease family protein [Nocardioides sp.]